MRIRFVATPHLSRNLADLAELREGASWWLSEETSWEIEVSGGAAPERRSTLRTLGERLTRASSRLPAERARIRCEVVGDGPGGGTEYPTGNVAPAASLPRDVNGTAAHAALLKLLASQDLAEARPRFERVESAELLPIMSGSSSEVRVGRADGTEPSGRLVAARVPARGSHGVAWESARAVTCAGATPLAIVCPIVTDAPSDGSAIVAWMEGWIAVTEAAAELGVATLWIRPDRAGRGVVTFGRISHAGEITPPFPSGAGERLVFLGETATEISGSRYLPAVHGLPAGAASPTDPVRERKLHEVLQTLTRARVITAALSVGAGGLLAAACGMLLAGEKPWGARLDVTSLGGTRADALLFGESSGRALVAVSPDRVGTVISEAHMHGVPAALIGEVTADPVLELKTRSLATEWRVPELQAAWGLRGQA